MGKSIDDYFAWLCYSCSDFSFLSSCVCLCVLSVSPVSPVGDLLRFAILLDQCCAKDDQQYERLFFHIYNLPCIVDKSCLHLPAFSDNFSFTTLPFSCLLTLRSTMWSIIIRGDSIKSRRKPRLWSLPLSTLDVLILIVVSVFHPRVHYLSTMESKNSIELEEVWPLHLALYTFLCALSQLQFALFDLFSSANPSILLANWSHLQLHDLNSNGAIANSFSFLRLRLQLLFCCSCREGSSHYKI